ncbi:MAG: hypothetical protein M1817_004208 [Caeruleum heppii]|nr:MAG: hypothetical protein M1817_004208 [Caeruleum heppii]
MGRGKRTSARERGAGSLRSRTTGLEFGGINQGGYGISRISAGAIPSTRAESPGITLVQQSLVDRSGEGSLQQEARNTQRHRSAWNPELNLRHNKVSFVNATDELDRGAATVAGQKSVESPKPSNLQRVMGEEEGNHEPATIDHGPTDITQSSPRPLLQSNALPNGRPFRDEVDSQQNTFFVDVVGSRVSYATYLPDPTSRERSPTLSESSGDIVVFSGRNNRGHTTRKRHASPTQRREAPGNIVRHQPFSGSDGEESKAHVASLQHTQPSPVSHGTVIDDPYRTPMEHSTSMKRTAPSSVSTRESSSRHEASVASKRIPRKKNKKQLQSDAEEAAVLDYIANFQRSAFLEGTSLQELHIGRDLGGSGSDNPINAQREMQDLEVPRHTSHLNGWEPGDIEDFDHLSTSDETHELIQDILSKRRRSRGLQYLIVWEGYTVDDARWIPSAALTMEGAAEKIQQFEERDQKTAFWYDASSTGSDSGSDHDDVYQPESDGNDGAKNDDQELFESQLVSLTDEKIARLLAKQEELGMGSDELMLFDDGAFSDAGSDTFATERGDLRASLARSAHKKPQRLHPEHMPTASKYGMDAYDGFDVMDWDRPSLAKQSKQSRSAPALGLSDSEMESKLRSSWAADRRKKQMKKAEREELRVQGLLGKKNQKKPNLKARYSEGMTMDAIKREVGNFLLSDHQSLALPPMDKRDRKLVHEIATAVGLKSKSIGGGRTRFPTLYKTTRTPQGEGDVLDRALSRLQRRFVPRMDRGLKKGTTRRHNAGSGAIGTAYRDGEVVGAAAPELGQENRGRAMLEKMGWSTGTALGAVDNKGILQPVAHVVKVSKAGLG